MNGTRRTWLAGLAAAALLWASPAPAVDLSAPGKALGKILHRSEPSKEPAANRPDRSGEARTPQATTHSAPAENVLTGPLSAPGDSLREAELMEEVLLSPEPYFYQSVGRRDPFESLVDEAYLAEHVEDNMSPSDLTVNGILWGENDRFALLETAAGRSLIVRDGDRVARFQVTRVEQDGVLLYWSEYGVGKTIRLSLADGKGR